MLYDVHMTSSPSRVAERVTVNLTERTSAALAQTADLTDTTKTDVINRALQVYALIQAAQLAGGEVRIKETATAELVVVRFF